MASFVEKGVAKIIKVLADVFPDAGAYILPHLLRANRSNALEFTLDLFPVEAIVVTGAQGTFEGSAQDIDVIQSYAQQGEWSPRTVSRIVAQLHGRNGHYVDVGANIGLTSVPVARQGISVIAIEPTPKNFALLKSNVARNGVEGQCQLLEVAILDKAGAVEFELSPRNHGDHRLRTGKAVALMGEERWSTVQVEGRTLDECTAGAAGPLVLKVDTQGAEPFVFAGGEKALARAEMLIFEFSPYQMLRMGAPIQPVIDVLSVDRRAKRTPLAG